MTYQEALQLVQEVCEQAAVPYKVHQKIQEALQIIRDNEKK